MDVRKAVRIALVLFAVSAAMADAGWPQDQKPRAPRATEDPRSLFRLLDKDHDGRLTRDEYASIFRNRAKADQSFQGYDANGDGVITEDEFTVLPDEMEQKMAPKTPQGAG